MYGAVAGAGVTAGVPAALAFTGTGGRVIPIALAVAGTAITSGVAAVRIAYRAR